MEASSLVDELLEALGQKGPVRGVLLLYDGDEIMSVEAVVLGRDRHEHVLDDEQPHGPLGVDLGREQSALRRVMSRKKQGRALTNSRVESPFR